MDNEFSISDYSLFQTGAISSNHFRENLADYKNKIDIYKGKLQDESVINGPCADNINEVFNKIGDEFISLQEAYDKIAIKLTDIFEHYRDGDKEGAKKLIDGIASSVSSTPIGSRTATPNTGGTATSADMQGVISSAESQIGVPYSSMHYGPAGSGDEGFGCAMFVSYCYNQALFNGARADSYGTGGFYGSTWDYWGNVTRDGWGTTNNGFVEVSASEAKPGDVVCYTQGGDPYASASSCSHVALYTGDGQIIGSALGGVQRGSVESQAISTSGGYMEPHYLHYVG